MIFRTKTALDREPEVAYAARYDASASSKLNYARMPESAHFGIVELCGRLVSFGVSSVLFENSVDLKVEKKKKKPIVMRILYERLGGSAFAY